MAVVSTGAVCKHSAKPGIRVQGVGGMFAVSRLTRLAARPCKAAERSSLNYLPNWRLPRTHAPTNTGLFINCARLRQTERERRHSDVLCGVPIQIIVRCGIRSMFREAGAVAVALLVHKLPNVLWNSRVLYRVHNDPS
jgi:hypothetical protein